MESECFESLSKWKTKKKRKKKKKTTDGYALNSVEIVEIAEKSKREYEEVYLARKKAPHKNSHAMIVGYMYTNVYRTTLGEWVNVFFLERVQKRENSDWINI